MKIITEKARIDAIADAVRQKLNVETQYRLSEIPAAIDNIYVGGELEPLSATENGDYTPGTGIEGFSRVHVAVPGPTLVTKNIVSNGTYNASSDNADGYSSVVVNVSGGGGAVVQPLNVTQNGDYFPPAGTDGFNEVHVSVSGGYPEPTGTIQITENGTVNVKDYASAEVNVPNSYAASDEGKVVKNGTLISQTARATEINTNGTYDTTENNSVIVNVSGGGGGAVVQPLSVTQNGTYNPPSGVDGYAPVTVNVSGGGGETIIPIVSASSTFGGSPKQTYGAFGDVSGNFWGAAGPSAWFNINFQTPYALSKILLSNYYRVSSSTFWYSSNITVRASNDGFSTYTDLYTGTGLAQSDTQFEIDLHNSTEYLEYRLIMSDSPAYAGLGRIVLQ